MPLLTTDGAIAAAVAAAPLGFRFRQRVKERVQPERALQFGPRLFQFHARQPPPTNDDGRPCLVRSLLVPTR